MQIKDEKAKLRAEFKQLRAAVAGKAEKSRAAAENLLGSDLYKNARQIFCYYPVNGEADTAEMIKAALADKKKVALPVCTDTGGNMDFYYIESLNDLKAGAFNIPAPDTEKCVKAADYSYSLIVVPALSFDVCGFRLGYGGGYYDKFLKKFINSTSYSAGMCYNELVSSALPREKHDISVDYILTEKALTKANWKL